MTLFYLALVAGTAYVIGFLTGIHMVRKPDDPQPIVVIDTKGRRR